MSYETMSLQGFIQEMNDVSSGPHPRKFCFVLGAGASRTSGIKSGRELVDQWDKELELRNHDGHQQWKADNGIDDSNKYAFYSQYYDRRFAKEPGDGYNFLEKIMEHAKPSAGYVMLAYLLSQTANNIVVTTNFDHLIEDAVNYYSQEIPLVIGHEALAHYLLKQTTRPTIVKIHRDLLLDPKSQTKELETLHENWEKSLAAIFSSYHAIFIGYAGNDKSLMNFLIDNSENFQNRTWRFPYWMLYKDDPLEGKILEFLNKADGYVIRHDGFDETLYQIGTEFGYTVPQKEQFLEDAKKRYQALSTSIDRFTEKYSREAEPSAAGEDTSTTDMGSEISQAIQKATAPVELPRMYWNAVALNNAGKYEESLKIKEELVRKAPDNALYQHSLGVTLHEMRRYEDALAAEKKAVGLEPDNARYLDSLSTTLHKMGRYEEALVTAQRAVELEPDNARYLDSLSATLHKMGRYEEALAAEQKAVELEPDNARYLDGLSTTLHKMGRYEDALVTAQRAVELEPDNAHYLDSLGVTLYEMGRHEEALTAIQTAINIDSGAAGYWDNLSAILTKMGRSDEAAAAKEKAAELQRRDN